MQTYSTADVARLTGASFRQLDYWDRTGLISPSIRQASGTGMPGRRYSAEDLARTRVIVALLRLGVSIQRIRRDGDPRKTVIRLLLSLSDPELLGETAA